MSDRSDGRWGIGDETASSLLVAGGLAMLGAVSGALRALWRPSVAAVGAHAWVVPREQAKMEAQWTRQALVHASESKKQSSRR